jgi:hypothetical protein
MEVMMKLSLALGALTFPLLFISNLLAIWFVACRTGVGNSKLALVRRS